VRFSGQQLHAPGQVPDPAALIRIIEGTFLVRDYVFMLVEIAVGVLVMPSSIGVVKL
jgi:hypothetical protein